MSEQQSLNLKFKLDELVRIFHDFCQLHTTLFEYTCDEYMHLLSSEIDQLDTTVQDKLKLLHQITNLDKIRTELTEEVMSFYGNFEKPYKLTALLALLRTHNEMETAKQLEGLNAILLDVIEKIQEQNKKNQVFLNKAIHSLQDLRESFAGKTNYKTYSAMGTTRSSGTL